MTDLPDPDGRLEAVRGAQEALGGVKPLDTQVLRAVEAGLLSVPGAGSPVTDLTQPLRQQHR